MIMWEYCELNLHIDEDLRELNELGALGWEAFSAVYRPRDGSIANHIAWVTFYLKRQKP